MSTCYNAGKVFAYTLLVEAVDAQHGSKKKKASHLAHQLIGLPLSDPTAASPDAVFLKQESFLSLFEIICKNEITPEIAIQLLNLADELPQTIRSESLKLLETAIGAAYQNILQQMQSSSTSRSHRTELLTQLTKFDHILTEMSNTSE
jgi:hypothetical protein